ncbi:selenocysteine lyase/cysteine desulfurase [Stackebrandtia endophytica]|uniref:Selenocysteine lyase/cysteine desulfurase n=1 Tax=Stackebrandtia endophytica TaxID=1496996 RepID=A0A543AXZ7_9ACTN|nr:aminotransferase class V-fold PLP-dependent enzyme [Stackebrandtia endophytica]TQL77448.1 selenocysteine lyase/cysteine desulfurase [Stackebrandtia endophytica]
MSLSTLIPARTAEFLPATPQASRVATIHSRLDVLPAPDVPLLDGTRVRYANFDYAASAPCSAAAAQAVAELLPRYTAVHRGAGWLSQQCTTSYEEARRDVARFVGARADDHVIFTRHTTEATTLLARSLPEGCRVVAFESEHHANLLPWKNLIRLPAPDSPTAAVRSIAAALTVLGDDDPVLVAVTGASNVTGELFPIVEIARVTRRFGARLLVDAAQLAPHRRIDLTSWDADYVVFSGHKLYAPFGTGVLAGRGDWLDVAEPHLAGGGAAAYVGDATGDIAWRTGPGRHEGGSPNVVGAVALAAVCRSFSDSTWERITDREESLRRRLAAGLNRIPGVRQLHLFGADSARVGTVAFTVDGLNADLVAAALSAEYGIGVRDGLFCAHPLTRRLTRRARDVAGPTHRGRHGDDLQAVRASVGLGSTEDDVDRLIEAVSILAADGPAWRYRVVNGRLAPVNDPRT